MQIGCCRRELSASQGGPSTLETSDRISTDERRDALEGRAGLTFLQQHHRSSKLFTEIDQPLTERLGVALDEHRIAKPGVIWWQAPDRIVAHRLDVVGGLGCLFGFFSGFLTNLPSDPADALEVARAGTELLCERHVLLGSLGITGTKPGAGLFEVPLHQDAQGLIAQGRCGRTPDAVQLQSYVVVPLTLHEPLRSLDARGIRGAEHQ